MCFSVTASFALGVSLIPIGVFSAVIAYRHNKHFLMFSLVPVFFGIQQCVEGMVWLRLEAGDPTTVYAYLYLWMAYVFWPVYMPISVYLVETEAARQKIIRIFVVAGVIFAAAVLAPGFMSLIFPKAKSPSHHRVRDQYLL